jgi:NAD(P)-dependent dehydrogenase (short-subunit alcohol dehydrogenase family)
MNSVVTGAFLGPNRSFPGIWLVDGRSVAITFTRIGGGDEEGVMYALSGRVGLVTGAGGGSGRAIARRLAREGVAVAVLDRDGGAAQTVAAEISGLAVTADVTEPDQVGRAVDRILGRLEKIDLLINNAGVAWMGPALDTPLEALQAMLRVNVEGTFIVSRAVLPQMIARRTGSVVNLASWAGKTGPAYFAGYSASKFAVIGLTQALAREMAPYGIRVNAICPGIVVDTAMRTAIEGQQRRYGLPETAEREKSIPIGRVSVPDDVARVAAFLASDESAYMTGESINLSGGLLMD